MEDTIQNLKKILKENLITVAEYGKKDKTHLIILEKLDASILNEVKQEIKTYHKKTKKYPLLLTKEELTDGLDVFPLEFLNIKLNHKILYGGGILKNLKFEKKFVRRELEFEFRSKLINLRQGYLEVENKKQYKIIIEKAIPTLLPILNGLLFLKDVDIPESQDEIFNLVSEKYKVDISILKNLETLTNEEESIKDLINLLSELGETLDEMNI
ncbi:MAG: hypothetical protein QGF74_02005 [Candidatus Nanoarchaeia archaeon]|jgi:hypothetical protein|nr:hypothetical protein [Candidatus Nanoarchaeia archaeon]|tara:strand:+ start:43602 stop:44240 length:639 start_codon:yes stop_codon:yes gene_type:complete